MEGRLIRRMDDVGSSVDELKHYLDERVGELRHYVDERSELVETRLLTEIHKWASPNEARQRALSAAIRALDTSFEDLEDRVKKLEGREPPQ